MKKFKKMSLLALLIGSLFFTGCDVSKITAVIQKITTGIQQAMPAIKNLVGTMQNVATSINNGGGCTQTSAPVQQNTNSGAGGVVSGAGDKLTGATQSTTTSGSSGSTAALNNYRGGRLSPSQFGKTFGPAAAAASRQTGVPASIILAQAALETGWGASAKAVSKNLFGIKGTGPAGSVRLPTTEYVHGRKIHIKAKFRKYHNWAESIADHGRLLQTSRYRNAMRYKNDPDRFAKELQRAGYATDPRYASKLISIMRKYNFYKYNK